MQHLGCGFPEKTVADNAEAQIGRTIQRKGAITEKGEFR